MHADFISSCLGRFWEGKGNEEMEYACGFHLALPVEILGENLGTEMSDPRFVDDEAQLEKTKRDDLLAHVSGLGLDWSYKISALFPH